MHATQIRPSVPLAPPATAPVLGPTWRRHGQRRSVAARIARLLRPVAHLRGGLVSCELAVPFHGRWYRPDVGVVLDAEVPIDGMLAHAPTLVVCLGGPLTAAEWAMAGAHVVWVAGGGVVRQVCGGRVVTLEPKQWLIHPMHPALRIEAEELLAAEPADAHGGA